MHGKAQIEAAERAQRERVLRLNHYSQNRKDQDSIRKLKSSLNKGNGGKENTPKKAQPNAQQASNIVIDASAFTFRSLDPSMFR
jgi:hypothetical protein